MKKNSSVQYTIRNIPPNLDKELRQRAKTSGKSFNQIALEALLAGIGKGFRPKRDLSEIVGSLTADEALELENEIRLQNPIDEEIWK